MAKEGKEQKAGETQNTVLGTWKSNETGAMFEVIAECKGYIFVNPLDYPDFPPSVVMAAGWELTHTICS